MLGREFRYPLAGLSAAALVVGAPWAVAQQPANSQQTYNYHHGDVLGTAMDLTVVAPSKADADAAEAAVLAEVARLAKILSAYDADGELAKLNTSPVNGPTINVSPELIDVLKQYDVWSKKTGGAYTGHIGGIVALWKQAEKDNRLPSNDALLAAAKQAAAPAWEIDDKAKTVRRISDQQINVDSLGKGYIIDKAVAAATKQPAKIRGLLLNIGGDLRTWGVPSEQPGAMWSVGVQDPEHPELNAKLLTTLFIPANASVSSSGGYQRFYTIEGKKYSHILDARTGKPGRNQAATVVAPDSATANALATASCVLKFTEAMELARSVPGAESMVITNDGMKIRTDGFKDLQDRTSAAERMGTKIASQFPDGFKMTIDLETINAPRRPYVFAWVTDANGKYIKTLAAYGNEERWLGEMREWSKYAGNDPKLLSTTHATQRSGKYPLSWDGTNQKGSGVQLGKYNIWVEVASEHGPYSAKHATIEIGKDAQSVTISKSSAFNDVTITYGPAAR